MEDFAVVGTLSEENVVAAGETILLILQAWDAGRVWVPHLAAAVNTHTHAPVVCQPTGWLRLAWQWQVPAAMIVHSSEVRILLSTIDHLVEAVAAVMGSDWAKAWPGVVSRLFGGLCSALGSLSCSRVSLLHCTACPPDDVVPPCHPIALPLPLPHPFPPSRPPPLSPPPSSLPCPLHVQGLPQWCERAWPATHPCRRTS